MGYKERRQCEIAAEAYAASLLAQAGFDVTVQYGANQPGYDLVADKDGRFLPISVKGSRDGGWVLSLSHKKKGMSNHDVIDSWFATQRPDLVFILVQFLGVPFGAAPRAYAARPLEIAAHLKSQRANRGYNVLNEISGSRAMYKDEIPSAWTLTLERLERIWKDASPR